MEWRYINVKIFGYRYKISEYGDIYSIKRNKLMSPSKDKDGYKRITLSFLGKSYYYRISRLVALHYVKNPNNYPQVNHLDGDKSNDFYKNLEWCSDVQNKQHAWENGLCKPIIHTNEYKKQMSIIRMGENNPLAKLNKLQVIGLRKDYNDKMNRKEMAKKYNISLRTVYRVGNGEYYSNI